MKIIRRLLFVPVLIWATAIASLCIYRQIPASDNDVESLGSTHVFSLGPVGEAARVSRGEVLFAQLITSSASNLRLQQLFFRGTAEAQAYALAGLRELSPRSYWFYATLFQAQILPRVYMTTGCVQYPEMRHNLATEIRSGEYMVHVKKYIGRANQALEPTTPAVTIPAAQEVAPAGVVAHL